MTLDRQVLTAAQMRAAEQMLIDGGETVESLMERAGKGAAQWVWRVASGRSVTVLCGPGNNGGDGFVIARELRARGADVRVVAPLGSRTNAAAAARRSYDGDVVEDADGGVLVDCLFGTGLARPLETEHAALLGRLARAHSVCVAVDLPSGVDSDSGALLNEDVPCYAMTVALGAWKRAHWLMPGMGRMGRRELVTIGAIPPCDGAALLLAAPRLAAPSPGSHKYTRGLVLVVAGPTPGATILACDGAMRAGAGAVRLSADALHPAASPDIVLRQEPLAELLADKRTGAVLVGCGLGRDHQARGRLAAVLATPRPTVIDADALHLLRPEDLAAFSAPLILTPHEGELAQLTRAFGVHMPDKPGQTLALARETGGVVVAKGPDTVIAAPDGRLTLSPPGPTWLSVAGSGDVLAGIITSRLAVGGDAFKAACEGVWLHAEAARLCGPAFLASDLARAVRAALACRL